ncbi:hypothetical protein JOD48_000384 [Oerskovia paurometabola]|nr:hypothetical protein [Oerskovia paurometabola]
MRCFTRQLMHLTAVRGAQSSLADDLYLPTTTMKYGLTDARRHHLRGLVLPTPYHFPPAIGQLAVGVSITGAVCRDFVRP